jgi:hypothetical protein
MRDLEGRLGTCLRAMNKRDPNLFSEAQLSNFSSEIVSSPSSCFKGTVSCSSPPAWKGF